MSGSNDEQWQEEIIDSDSHLVKARIKAGFDKDDESITTNLKCDLCVSLITSKLYYECETHNKTICVNCVTDNHRRIVYLKEAMCCVFSSPNTMRSHKWKDCIYKRKEASPITQSNTSSVHHE